MESHAIEELEIGQSAEFAKTITETDIAMFCAISGDFKSAPRRRRVSRFGAPSPTAR